MTTERVKEIIGRILYVGSIGMLAGYGFMVIISFVFAARDGRIPHVWWDLEGANHGPWRHCYPARIFLNGALASLLSGALTAGTTPKFMRGYRPVALLATAIGLLIIHFVFLNWLID
jgi:hypothetical protein